MKYSKPKIEIAKNNKQKLTMNKLAKKIGLTREYLQEIKRGSKGQTLENLAKIATSLKCFPSELLPEDWQKPEIKINDKMEVISDVINIYEKLKANKRNVSPKHLTSIITMIIENNIIKISDEEIEKLFTIILLSRKNLPK